MFTHSFLLPILQALVVSAKLGWRENCHDRPSVWCNGVLQKMPRKDCEAGYKHVYCAKIAVFSEWQKMDAIESTYHRIDEPRCILIGDNEIRVVLPYNAGISDLSSMCGQMVVRDQQKAKRRPKRFHFVAQSTMTAPVIANHTTTEPSSQLGLEQQFGLSYLTVQNVMFINAMAIFVFVVVIAIRKTRNSENIPFYYDDISTIPECDGAVYSPCVGKVNTISNPSFVA